MPPPSRKRNVLAHSVRLTHSPRVRRRLALAEDEAALIPAIGEQQERFHWILVPHEADETHLQKLTDALETRGVPSQRLSRTSEWDGRGALIVDEFGQLLSIYKLSHCALIGGSFKSRVHSVMEALACGNLTLVGPYHANNREALEFCKGRLWPSSPAVRVVSNAHALSQALKDAHLWTDMDRRALVDKIRSKPAPAPA